MLLLAALALAVAPQDQGRDARVERILATAERYATLRWEAREEHLFHGEDEKGVPVNTPDSTLAKGGWQVGTTNVGVPYKWGGWATPEQFLAGLERGAWAGHWPLDPSDIRGTAKAVGVDCSGFVSRCWDLPYKHSTRSLGPLCWEIGWEDLRPGDLLNSFDGHAMLFESWANKEHTSLFAYEAGWPGVLRSERAVEALKSGKMVPQRYKPLDPRWPAITPASAQLLAGDGTFEAGEDIPIEELDVSLRGRSGDWVLYRWTRPAGEQELRRTLAAAGEAGFDVIGAVRSDEGLLERLDHFERGQGLLGLHHLVPANQALDSMELIEVSAQAGSYSRGARKLDAQRIELAYEGTFTARGRSYPYRVDLTVLRSDALPLEGVLEARIQTTYDLGQGPQQSVTSLDLQAYGR